MCEHNELWEEPDMRVAKVPEPGMPDTAIRRRFEVGICSYLSLNSHDHGIERWAVTWTECSPQVFLTSLLTCCSILPKDCCCAEGVEVVVRTNSAALILVPHALAPH